MTNAARPPVDTPVDQLDTPCLLLDLDAFERNLHKMADFMAQREANLRPHVKTHKCSTIAKRQIEAGAQGLTCAKLGEAEVMAAAGIRDLLIANQVVGATKIQRLVELAEKSDVIVAVESVENARQIASAASRAGVKVNAIIEVDTGMSRCGTQPGKETAALAQAVVGMDGLRFRGVMGYEGHAVLIKDFEEKRRVATQAAERLLATVDELRAKGIDVEIVSAGGTGTYMITSELRGITEIEAGSYIVMDTTYSRVMPEFENALALLSLVISRRGNQWLVTDMGKKAATEEFGLPELRHVQGAKLVGLSEEHGKLEILDPECPLQPGDKVQLIPSHCCTTINLHDEFFCVRGGKLEAVWEIDARGKVR